MIDTKKTYETLLGLDFSAKQAEGLTGILKAQDADKLEGRLIRVESKLDLLLWMWPLGIALIGLGITILGWIVTHPGRG